MSVEAGGTAQEPESLEIRYDSAPSMADILDFLAPEADDAEAGAGGADGAPAAADAGQQQPAGEGAGGAGGAAGAPAAGDGGVSGVPGAADPAAGTGQPSGDRAPGVGSVDASSLSEKWAEVSTAFETNQTALFQESALEEVRGEYPRHFAEVSVHPRELVGKEVPKVNGEPGMERLRDAADAKDWQDAMKRLLVEEVQGRVSTKQDEMRETFATVHASIDLFRNNVDLIPGTKQFDGELAKQFVALAKDYEIRSDNKLVGYSVPVQPLVNQLRTQLAAQRAAAPAAPAAPTAQQQRAAEQPRTSLGTFDGPDAGLRSKAGSGGGGESEADGLMGAFFRQNGFSL